MCYIYVYICRYVSKYKCAHELVEQVVVYLITDYDVFFSPPLIFGPPSDRLICAVRPTAGDFESGSGFWDLIHRAIRIFLFVVFAQSCSKFRTTVEPTFRPNLQTSGSSLRHCIHMHKEYAPWNINQTSEMCKAERWCHHRWWRREAIIVLVSFWVRPKSVLDRTENEKPIRRLTADGDFAGHLDSINTKLINFDHKTF